MVDEESDTGGDGGLTKREVLRAGAGVGMSGIAAAAFSGAGAAAGGSSQSKEVSEETKEKLKNTAQAYSSKKSVVAAFKSEGQPLIAALRKEGFLGNQSLRELIQPPSSGIKDGEDSSNTIVRALLLDEGSTADITVTIDDSKGELKLRLLPGAGRRYALLRPNGESDVKVLRTNDAGTGFSIETTVCCVVGFTVCVIGCSYDDCGCGLYTTRCCGNGNCYWELEDPTGCGCTWDSPTNPCEPVSCPDRTSY